MSEETGIRTEPSTPAASAKREWVEPRIVIAPGRDASAFGGPPGGVDYGIYS